MLLARKRPSLTKQVTQDLRPFALQLQKNRSFYGRLCLL